MEYHSSINRRKKSRFDRICWNEKRERETTRLLFSIGGLQVGLFEVGFADCGGGLYSLFCSTFKPENMKIVKRISFVLLVLVLAAVVIGFLIRARVRSNARSPWASCNGHLWTDQRTGRTGRTGRPGTNSTRTRRSCQRAIPPDSTPGTPGKATTRTWAKEDDHVEVCRDNG